MELLRFKKEMFEHQRSFPKGWHLMNTARGQQGEYTLCGIAFDGDANSSGLVAEIKKEGKITCECCRAIIRLCKLAKI